MVKEDKGEGKRKGEPITCSLAEESQMTSRMQLCLKPLSLTTSSALNTSKLLPSRFKIAIRLSRLSSWDTFSNLSNPWLSSPPPVTNPIFPSHDRPEAREAALSSLATEMASILTSNPEFTTRYLLTLRSPWAFIHRLVDIALRFAALGHVDEAVELLEMADAYVPIPARSIQDKGLYFAFQAADWWPDFTPDEDMEDEDLLRSLDVLTVNTSFGRLFLDLLHGGDAEEKVRDRRYLSRVLQFLKDREGSWKDREGLFTWLAKGEEEEEDSDDEDLHRGPVKSRLTMAFDSAVIFGFHLAINKLDDQEATEKLCEVIGGDLEHYLPRLARHRFVWPVLVKGILGPKTEDGKKEVQAEFERLKSVVKRRMKNGVEFPFLDDGMRDLVKMLDQNTRHHVRFAEYTSSDEEEEAPSLYPISSIRHPGASKESIEELELRLDVELPSDYKEFLSISDGMDLIWNGHYRQRLLAPSSKIHHKAPRPKLDPDIGDSAPYPPLVILSLIPGMELPENFMVIWPMLEPEACLVIAEDKEGGGRGSLWLVRAYMVRKARNRLMERIEMLKEGNDGEEQRKQRRWVERLVGDYFGGLEELGELGEGERWEKEEGMDVMHWAVVYWDERGLPTEVWSSFREWMENAVVKSEFPGIVLEKRDLES